MKIMLIPTGYPSDDNRATMLFVYEQARALAEAGHEITVLHVQRQPSRMLIKKVDTSFRIVDDGFATRYFTRLKTFAMHQLPKLNRHNFERRMYRLFLYAQEHGAKPDVIYAHFSCWAGCVAVRIGREFHIPVVTMEHYGGFVFGKRIEKAYLQGLRETVEQSAAMMCVSEKLKTSIQALTGTKRPITVIPNMVDKCFVYHEIPPHQGFRFCTLGHLKPGKRMDMLAEAFCEAFSADENVSLRIGGAGAEREKIQKIINDHGRKDQILMLGRLTREESEKLYEESDCFVLPSAFETFGLVYREAMGVGRPVITTDHGGWGTDDWSDDFGIKIAVDHRDQLVAAMKTMIRNYSSYDRRKISRFIEEHYSVSAIALRIETVLKAAVEAYHGK